MKSCVVESLFLFLGGRNLLIEIQILGAGVPADVGNRTDWPVDGGALSVTLHHAWTYLFVNVGLGDNVANFNISLTPQLLNTTGRGDLCLPKLSVPEGTVGDGQRATLQVITNDGSGASLYNVSLKV